MFGVCLRLTTKSLFKNNKTRLQFGQGCKQKQVAAVSFGFNNQNKLFSTSSNKDQKIIYNWMHSALTRGADIDNLADKIQKLESLSGNVQQVRIFVYLRKKFGKTRKITELFSSQVVDLDDLEI